MKAKCIALSLTEDQRKELGATAHLRSVYQLSVGREYTVLGILFVVRSSVFGCTPLFDVEDDAGVCCPVPACLFDIVDPHPSQYWRVRRLGPFDLALWPEEFYQEYFHDHLSDGSPKEIREFRDLTERLNSEFE